ncbi:MAG: TonB-dependent receptor [Oxalobacter sp.]|nr:MAG: TonB-dependent receptor [Oxalobacter sp.]
MTFPVSTFRTPAWKPLALASAISAIFSSAVQAQSDDIKSLAPVVVTASRIEQSQAEAIPHTTVITTEEIRNSRASDVTVLLQTQAGVEISQSGGAGSLTSLFMRGANSNQSLILIDGIPIRDTTATGTAAALQHILPDQIERIEIVRGNVSAIYGSGAIGGVIQIFTKQGTGEPKVNLSTEVGSRGTTKVSGGVSGKSGGTRYMLSASRYETEGFSSTNTKQYSNENPDKDGDRNVSVAGAISHEWSRGHEIGTRFYGYDAKFSYDNGGSGPNTRIDEGTSENRTLSVFSKNRLIPNWLSTVTVSETETLRKDTGTNLGVVSSDSRYKGNTSMLQWTNEVMLTPNWIATIGVDAAKERADVYSFGWGVNQYEKSRSNASAYAGLNGKYDTHSLQANVRRDHVGGAGSDTTGYLGYGYALTSSWKAIANVSTAFLAPTLYQLYDPLYGNSDLTAERSRSKEVGLQYTAGSTLIRTVFFESKTRDMIGYDSSWNTVNIDESSNRGMETSASGRIMGIDARASLTLQSPKDETTGDALSRRAKTLASVAASRFFGAFRLGGDIQYVGHRDNSGYDDYELSSYVLTNLNARYQINKEVSVYGRVENVFDKDYQTAYGYNQAERGFFAGIEWRQ